MEVEDWVIYLSSTTGRASTHDCLIMMYWVIMNLVMHVLLNLEARREEVETIKEGDEEPAKSWKEHNADCWVMHKKLIDHGEDFHLMHPKVDQIVLRLEIVLYHLGM